MDIVQSIRTSLSANLLQNWTYLGMKSGWNSHIKRESGDYA